MTTRSIMKVLGTTILTGAVGFAASAPAGAAGSTISPKSQTVYNTTAKWTGSWTGVAPYFVSFYYDYANSKSSYSTYSGSAKSHGWSHTYPDTCGSNSYQQEQLVSDTDGNVASDTSSTQNSGAHGC